MGRENDLRGVDRDKTRVQISTLNRKVPLSVKKNIDIPSVILSISARGFWITSTSI